MRFFDNNPQRPDAYYEPDSFNGPKENKRHAEPPLPLHGDANRFDHRDGNDDYKCDPAYGAGVAKAVELDPGMH